MATTYDTRCYDLAEVFLSDAPSKNTPLNRRKLAQAIQETIESEIETLEDSNRSFDAALAAIEEAIRA